MAGHGDLSCIINGIRGQGAMIPYQKLRLVDKTKDTSQSRAFAASEPRISFVVIITNTKATRRGD